jgi:hypothetical protein
MYPPLFFNEIGTLSCPFVPKKEIDYQGWKYLPTRANREIRKLDEEFSY